MKAETPGCAVQDTVEALARVMVVRASSLGASRVGPEATGTSKEAPSAPPEAWREGVPAVKKSGAVGSPPPRIVLKRPGWRAVRGTLRSERFTERVPRSRTRPPEDICRPDVRMLPLNE